MAFFRLDARRSLVVTSSSSLLEVRRDRGSVGSSVTFFFEGGVGWVAAELRFDGRRADDFRLASPDGELHVLAPRNDERCFWVTTGAENRILTVRVTERVPRSPPPRRRWRNLFGLV